MFAAHDWYDLYQDSKEAIPEDALTPRGDVDSTHCFVDTKDAGDRDTWISQTRVLIVVTKAPILWYSQ